MTKSFVVAFFISYIWRFMRTIWIILDLLFGNSAVRKMLDVLYTFFGDLSIETNDSIVWDDNILINQVDYLLEEYTKSWNKISKKQIKEINFDTNLRVENKKELSRFKRLSRESALYVCTICLLMIIFYELGLHANDAEIMWKVLIFGGGYVIILFEIICKVKGLATTLITIFYDAYGYEFVLEKNNLKWKVATTRYATEYGLMCRNRWSRYVNSVKNIIVFADIVKQSGKQKELEKILEEIKSNCENNDALKVILIILDYKWNCGKNIKLYIKEDKLKYGKYAKAFIADMDLPEFVQVDSLNLSKIDQYLNESKTKRHHRIITKKYV